MKNLSILYACFLTVGCGALSVYGNANEPVDRAGRENWALVSVDKGNVGSILISPRPKGNVLKAMASAGNHNARREILLEPGINDINVYAFNGSQNALFVVSDIPIEENSEYLVQYSIEGRKVNVWIVNKKTGQIVKK